MNLQLLYRYILSLSKTENLFYEKTKTKGPKNKRQKQFQMVRVEPQTSDMKCQLVIFCARTTDTTNCC